MDTQFGIIFVCRLNLLPMAGCALIKWRILCLRERNVFYVPLIIKHHSVSLFTICFVVNFNLRYVLNVNVKTLFYKIKYEYHSCI